MDPARRSCVNLSMMFRVRVLVMSVLFGACQHASPDPVAAPAPATAASDGDQQLVFSAKRDRTELVFTAPTAEHVTVSAISHLAGTAWDVDLVVDGKVVETVHTSARSTGEGNNLEPIAAVATVPEGVLFISGSSKTNGKPDNVYDARVLSWDASKKQLVVARKIAFEQRWSPGPDDDMGASVGSDGCPATEPVLNSACPTPVQNPNLGCGYPAARAGAVPHHCLCSDAKWACYPEGQPENP